MTCSLDIVLSFFVFFFFQAEDGIRDSSVTGVQTCALPICEFSKLGVKAEEEALVLYRKLIEEAAKNGDWETREMFEKIYGEEEKHLFKFQEYVNIQDEAEGSSKVPISEWRKIFTDDYY